MLSEEEKGNTDPFTSKKGPLTFLLQKVLIFFYAHERSAPFKCTPFLPTKKPVSVAPTKRTSSLKCYKKTYSLSAEKYVYSFETYKKGGSLYAHKAPTAFMPTKDLLPLRLQMTWFLHPYKKICSLYDNKNPAPFKATQYPAFFKTHSLYINKKQVVDAFKPIFYYFSYATDFSKIFTQHVSPVSEQMIFGNAMKSLT